MNRYKQGIKRSLWTLALLLVLLLPLIAFGVKTGFAQGPPAHMVVALDRSGSMTTIRTNGNTRCEDAILHPNYGAITRVNQFLSDYPDGKVSVRTFAATGWTKVTTPSFVDGATAIAALNGLDPQGCSGLTPLAMTLCDASFDLVLSGAPHKRIHLSSDGEENNSSGQCAGPASVSSTPPYDAGSWHQKVWNLIVGFVIVDVDFWGVVQLQAVDSETGQALSANSVPVTQFLQQLPAATNGTYTYIDDGGSTSGTTRYVAPNGTDSGNNCIDSNNPCQTIQHGIDVATAGNMVLVQPGTYVENLNFNGKNIEVKSTDGPDVTIIDGNQNGSVVTFENGEDSTTLLNGFRITNGLADYGGGIHVNDASPRLKKLIVSGNTATNNQIWAGGGGIHLIRSTAELVNLVVTNNTAYRGAGVSLWEYANPTLKNVLISGNTATDFGGGMEIRYHGHDNVNLINVTIVDNQAGAAGGGAIAGRNNGASVNLVNSILWNNTPQELSFVIGNPQTITVSYSNIQGGQSAQDIASSVTVNSLDGNIDADPLFVDAANEDYRLSDNSPAIGTGTSNNVPNTDIEGNPRPNPAGSNPDMGAHENSLGSVGDFISLSLELGWNLISTPIQSANTNITQVLDSIDGDYDLALAYDGCDTADPWKKYDPSAPPFANDLHSIDYTMGVWIHATSAMTLNVTAMPQLPISITIPLCTGWNLTGYPSTQVLPSADAFNSIAGQHEITYTYDAADSADPWKKYDSSAPPFANDLTGMRSKLGYWTKVTQDADWLVNN